MSRKGAGDRQAFYNLWSSLGDPAPREIPWEDLLRPRVLPSPWLAWLLLGLFRHRRRQQWVADIVTTRLDGDLDQLAGYGALGHPARPQSGSVPGLPEWEYYFHGIGCCLTHRVTGEAIDVDFFGDGAEGFCLYFYEEYLKSLRQPPAVERRLLELFPAIESIRFDFDRLEELGLLVPVNSDRQERGGLRLAPALLAHDEQVEAFCAAWEEPARQAELAARLGDWLAVETCVDQVPPRYHPGIVAGAENLRRQRQQMLAATFREPEKRRVALQALADLGGDLVGYLRQALRGPIDGTVSCALASIESRPDAATWCSEIAALLSRLDPEGPLPHPYLWVAAIRLLLTQGWRKEAVIGLLPRTGGPMLGEAALVALEHAPPLALELLRRALRSTVPANRTTAAAILAIIDRPWSQAELLSILAESDDQTATADARSALAESADPALRQAVLDWEERNPHEPETSTWISMSEMLLRTRSQWLRHEMEELRDRVLPLRRREEDPSTW